jgi:hypothetical protein
MNGISKAPAGAAPHSLLLIRAMDTPFGVDWDELNLPSLRQYLAGAEHEPLLWECKGKKLHPASVRKAVCAFANGHDPGYLILGAEESGDGWKVTGFAFPEEPPKWVSETVRDGVRPYPLLDVKAWPIAENSKRPVAVVRVEPVATPPCNSGGTVYERISGASVSVKDPTRLANLYTRGDNARRDAQGNADTLAGELINDMTHPDGMNIYSRFALALSATGNPADIGSRLFTESYELNLREIVKRRLSAVEGRDPGTNTELQQDSLKLWTTRPDQMACRKLWTVRVHWSGTVAIQYQTPHQPAPVDALADGAITDAWIAASELIGALKGYGPSYMTLRIYGATGTRDRWGNSLEATVRQGPVELPPVTTVVARVKRELQRAAGDAVYEPDLDE